MKNSRIIAVIMLLLAGFAGYFTYSSEMKKEGTFGGFPFKYGLDLRGGTHLVYQADTKAANTDDINGAMESLRDTIERRINAFGIAEPIVQTEKASVGGEDVYKLIVELPGVTDLATAEDLIGKTPILEFKLLSKAAEEATSTESIDPAKAFENTALSGRYLKNASLNFNPTTGEPTVSLAFNDEGKAIFAKITKENVGRALAIFLDGTPISTPVIREEIKDGRAEISGSFTPESARELVRNLNYGALPLPIARVGSQSVGASLGDGALHASAKAGIVSFIVIAIFLILWYRLPGVIATVALASYVALNLAIFKLIGVTLTSAGLAGFVLSMGMAVDANILIFERFKEEIKRGLNLQDAVHEGFKRAWLSIRDSNLSSIITGVILFYLATTPLIKGFALVFIIGVAVSAFTAITMTRVFLFALGVEKTNKFTKFLFGNGFTK